MIYLNKNINEEYKGKRGEVILSASYDGEETTVFFSEEDFKNIGNKGRFIEETQMLVDKMRSIDKTQVKLSKYIEMKPGDSNLGFDTGEIAGGIVNNQIFLIIQGEMWHVKEMIKLDDINMNDIRKAIENEKVIKNE